MAWVVFWRTVHLSMIIASLLVLPAFAIGIFELWLVPPGQGYFNADETIALSNDEKTLELARSLMRMSVSLAIVAAVMFLLQLPFLVGRLIAHRRSRAQERRW